MWNTRLLTAFLCTVACVCFDPTAAFSQKGEQGKLADLWDGILTSVVHPQTGKVDYLKVAKDSGPLEAFIKAHDALDVQPMDENERKALYINLYNATMVYNLLKYAKENSIDVIGQKFLALEVNVIKGPGGDIWEGDYSVKLAGKDVNLHNIEHDLIRREGDKSFKSMMLTELDPRIHAAVNCAALSCPRVREKAYRAETVDQMLDENMQEYVNSEQQFAKVGGSKLKANQIVFWYYGDFDVVAKQHLKLKGAGDYLAQFVNDARKDAAWIKAHLKATFNDRSKFSLLLSSDYDFFYNWKINDQRN